MAVENGLTAEQLSELRQALEKLSGPILGELRILYLHNPLKAIVLIDREYFGTYEFERKVFVRE